MMRCHPSALVRSALMAAATRSGEHFCGTGCGLRVLREGDHSGGGVWQRSLASASDKTLGRTVPRPLETGLALRTKHGSIYIQSPEQIADPYRIETPSLSEFLSIEGWKRRIKRWMSLYRDAVALAYTRYKLGQKVTRQKFKEDITKMFREVNQALAKESVSVLRRYVIEAKIPLMKKLIKSRKSQGWHKVDWHLDSIDKLTILRARIVRTSSHKQSPAFAQAQLKIESTQYMKIWDKGGRPVQAKLENSLPDTSDEMQDYQRFQSVDYWIVERHIADDPQSAWRLIHILVL